MHVEAPEFNDLRALSKWKLKATGGGRCRWGGRWRVGAGAGREGWGRAVGGNGGDRRWGNKWGRGGGRGWEQAVRAGWPRGRDGRGAWLGERSR